MIDPASKGIEQSQIIWIAIVFFLFLVLLVLLAFGYLIKWYYRRRLLEEIRLINEAQKSAKSGSELVELQSKLITLIGQLQELNSKKDNARNVDQLVQFNQSLEKAIHSTHHSEGFNQPRPYLPMQKVQKQQQGPMQVQNQQQAPKQVQRQKMFERAPSKKNNAGVLKRVPLKKDSTVVMVEIPDEPQQHRPEPSKRKPKLYYVDEKSTSLDSLSSNRGIRERETKRHPKRRRSITPTSATPSKSNTSTPYSTSKTSMTPTTPKRYRPKTRQSHSSRSALTTSPRETSDDEEEVLFDNGKKAKGSKRQQHKGSHHEEFDTDDVANMFPGEENGPSYSNNKYGDIATDDEVIIDDFLDAALADEPDNSFPEATVGPAGKDPDEETIGKDPKRKPAKSKPRTKKLSTDKTQSSPKEKAVPPEKNKRELVTDKTQSSPDNSKEAKKKPNMSSDLQLSSMNQYWHVASDGTPDCDHIHLPNTAHHKADHWRVVTEGTTDYNHIHSPSTGRLQQVVVKAHENTVWYPPTENKNKQLPFFNPSEWFTMLRKHDTLIFSLRR